MGRLFKGTVQTFFATGAGGAVTTTLDTLAGALKGSKDGKVITAGDSAHSDLVLSVAHVGNDKDTFMPKGKGAQKLTDEQIGLIRAWIDQGAK